MRRFVASRGVVGLLWLAAACGQVAPALPAVDVAAELPPEEVAGDGFVAELPANDAIDAALGSELPADEVAEAGSRSELPANAVGADVARTDLPTFDTIDAISGLELPPDDAGDTQPPPETAAVAEVGADTALDAADAAGDVGGAVEVVADTAAEVAAATPTTAVLPITVQTQLPELQGLLKVKVMPAAVFLAGKMAESADTIDLYGGAVPKLPLQLTADLPPGDWMAFAMVLGSSGPAAAALSCGPSGAKIIHVSPEQVLAGQPLPAATLNLNAVVGNFDTQKLCGVAVPAALTQLSWTATPPTLAGGAHLLQAASAGERMWVAGSQDGLVSFDLPNPLPALPALANWTVHGGAFCNRILVSGGRIYCASRAPYLQVFTLDLAKAVQTPTKVPLDAPAEAMAVQGEVLWVAGHAAGLIARQAAPPYGPVAVKITATLQDSWDVRPVGAQVLLVADGRFGLKALQVDLAGAWTQTAALPLAGCSVALQVADKVALVAALGGGLHAVDIALPAQPKWMATLQLPGMALGAAVGADGLAVADGHHVVVAPLPVAAIPGKPPVPWLPRRLLPTLGYAMDAAPGPAATLRTAEFVGVRQWQWGTVAPAAGPIAWVPPTVTSTVGKVGADIVTTVSVVNLGGQPLHIGPIAVDETPGAKPTITLLSGQWTIAPGQLLQLPVALTKTVKGITTHQLHLYTDDAEGQLPVTWLETTWPVPGDKLPPLTYNDAAGNAHNVTESFAGKVGVLMVAAQACPVAALALAGLSADLDAQLKAGQVVAFGLNPWDKPAASPEVAAIQTTFPMLYSPLTTKDNHDASEVLDQLLGQPGVTGPPMPLVYVVGKNGAIVHAKWGYDPLLVQAAIQQALLQP